MHSSKNNKKKSKDAIDQLSDEDLDHIFDRMQQFFESDDFKDIVEDIMYDVLSDEDEEDVLIKPSFEFEDDYRESYSDSFLVDSDFFDDYSEENSPEVLTSKKNVMVTLSLPRAQKSDIDLHVTSNYVDITVKAKNHRFHRMIDLPEDVDPCSTKATFRNGVLDIIMRKTGSHDQGCKISLS